MVDALRFIAPRWRDIHEMLRALSEKILNRGLRPDIAVGIAMGGLIPAVVLADLLGLEVDAVGAKLYRGVGERGNRPRITQDVSVGIEGRAVLLVDDVADSGRTLEAVKEYVLARRPRELVTCTIHYKPWSIVKPDIYIEETDAWIIYPWERREALGDIIERFKAEGVADDEMRREMTSRGIPRWLIENMLQ